MARANGPVVNMDAWYSAFDVKPGDRMFIAPDKRIHIW
jgi:predicted metalloendopeptidase